MSQVPQPLDIIGGSTVQLGCYAPVLQHELQGLAVKVAGEVKLVDHVELICAHVHEMLVQLESPHMLCVKAPVCPMLG